MRPFHSFFIVPVLLCLLLSSSHAADPQQMFEIRTLQDKAGNQLPYRLFKPDSYDEKNSYPLILFLHGAGERGSDNRKQLVHGMQDLCGDQVRKRFPCFVIAPQCPSGQSWADVHWGLDAHTMHAKPSVPLQLALDLIDVVQKEFSVDADRLYITGLSMGGFGTWDAIQRQPHRFAAAVPICGGGDTAEATRLARLPIWAFHGGKDNVVKPKRSRDMIDAIKAAGGTPAYTEYPDLAHNSWAKTYSNLELYEWMFDQRRPENQE